MNLIKTIEKEIEKGNTLVLQNGNTVSEDYYLNSLEKEYLRKAKAGELDIKKVSFEQFASEEIGNTLPTQEVLNFLTNVLENGQDEGMDEPQPRDLMPADETGDPYETV